MKRSKELLKLLVNAAAQGKAFERRMRSRIELQYSDAMQTAAKATTELTHAASFDELIHAEKVFQKNDLRIYAQRPATVKSVQEGMQDLADGEAVYRQLIEKTEAYKEHVYRRKERIPPEHIIPLDAMRRAIRGQVKRVANYRANVMGNMREQDFLSARIEMLHRAEALYDAMQRERLLPQEQEKTDA